jgi:hypothetical protein
MATASTGGYDPNQQQFLQQQTQLVGNTGINPIAPGTTPQPLGAGAAGAPTPQQITSAYEQYLGRDPGTQGGNYGAETAWEAGDPNWMQTIQNSPEAAKYSAGQGGFNAGSGAYVPGAGVKGQGTIFGGGAPGSTGQNATDLYKYLYGLGTSSPTIDANDPIIKAQTDAYRAEQDRAGRSYLAQAAESGGPNTNLDAVARSMAEQGAQSTGAFQANLMGNELSARRNQIQQALSGAQGLLTSEQQAQLQEELSQLGLAQNAYQFDQQQQYLNSPLASGG